MDVKVQPNDEPVILNGSESTDDNGIVNYEWTLLFGDSSVVMKVRHITCLLRFPSAALLKSPLKPQ